MSVGTILLIVLLVILLGGVDGQTAAIWTVALAVIGLAFTLLVKSPKESASETSQRLDELEDSHHKLDVRTSVAYMELSTQIAHLVDAINYLRQTIKNTNQGRISGRQPRSP